jgi:hypothetical protein
MSLALLKVCVLGCVAMFVAPPYWSALVDAPKVFEYRIFLVEWAI